MDNLNINYEELSNKLNEIEKDILSIEEILKDVDKETESLNDEKIWKSPEKTKMDSDYIPYVKTVSVNAPMALRKHLNHLRNVLNIYQSTEEEIIEDIYQEKKD